MRKAILNFCMFIAAMSFAVAIYGSIFLSNKTLNEIADWQLIPFIATMSVLVLVLLPLTAFRVLRPILQPGFTIAATLLFICILGVCPTYVGNTWGGFWGFAGFFFMGFGYVPFCLLAMLFQGDWLMLSLLVTCLVALAGCLYGSMSLLENADEQTPRPQRPAPRVVSDASDAVWVLLCFFIPYGLYSSGQPYWLWLVPIVGLLAICLRKAYRWAHLTFLALAAAYFWTLFTTPGTLTALPDLRTLDPSTDINRYVNQFIAIFKVLLKVNGGFQHAVVAYAAFLLLTPSGLRSFWRNPVVPDAAGLRRDTQGHLLDEHGNIVDKDRRLEFPLEKSE